MDVVTDQLFERQSRMGLARVSSLFMLTRQFTRIVRKPNSRPGLSILFLLLVPVLANAVELKPETLQAWDAYVRTAKTRMQARANGREPFLWVAERPDFVERVRAGEILVEAVYGSSPHAVPLGLIHDWIGAVFVPKTTLDAVLGVLNDYPRYKDFYRPMLAKARVLENTPDDEKVSVLMVQKAYSVTAAVEIDDDVHLERLGADRAWSSSISVHVREIADYGKPTEHAFPEGYGPGYLWRTFFITRLEQRDNGVYIEMEMIGLSRNIPWMFRWLIQPLAERLPHNVLQETLKDTRDAVVRETQ